MNIQNQNFMNAVDIAALLIGILNMLENEQQSAYNDVHSANDKQARFLLEELGKKFDEQNKILKDILNRLQE